MLFLQETLKLLPQRMRVSILPESQEHSALGKRLFSDISPYRDNFPPETGLLQVVVNRRLCNFEKRPDFNFETADAHYPFSKELDEEGEEYFTPHRELEVYSTQAAFRMTLDSPDLIETNSSLGSNSEETDNGAHDSIRVDQFGSFMESDSLEKLDLMLNPVSNDLNQKKDMVAAESKGDARRKKNEGDPATVYDGFGIILRDDVGNGKAPKTWVLIASSAEKAEAITLLQ
ncbi:uncharacterized protein LOC113290267 isoform X2 [Papaver somniferum]|uniref:uncharacterized protein LOC113290267 isoform X2 n=1 Tax=Papaver somniferum TaxID=3469 RepID=UPI000E702A39|nr:uncharacterized protein LOC113290267 isoform X2 [Papaver somniferum]